MILRINAAFKLSFSVLTMNYIRNVVQIKSCSEINLDFKVKMKYMYRNRTSGLVSHILIDNPEIFEIKA